MLWSVYTKATRLFLDRLRLGKSRVLLFAAFIALATPSIAFAQIDPGTSFISDTIGLSSGDPRIIAARIIQLFLSFLGLIALIVILYGGFTWMTSQGEEEKVDKAKRILTNAVIGLIIIIMSVSISQFLIRKFLTAAQDGGGGGAGSIGDGGDAFGRGRAPSVGVNALDYHIPERGARNVSRDTVIVLKFKEPIRVGTVLQDGRVSGRAILVTNDDVPDQVVALQGEVADEEETLFVFRPNDLLGSADRTTRYTVTLSEAILTKDGTAAFGRGGYSWTFETSTRTDSTPPYVVSIIPREGATEPRNTIVSVTFSEPVLPAPILSGAFSVSNGGAAVAGKLLFGNGLTTIEFRTNEACGRNSCGEQIFCLPANGNISARVRSATPSGQAARARVPFDGVVDLAGNALDGDRDDTVEGSPADDFTLSFRTNDTIDLVPPVIRSTTPIRDAADINVQTGIEALFSKPLAASSVTTDTFSVRPEPEGGFRVGVLNADVEGRATLRTYAPHLQPGVEHTARATSGIRDTRQNCFMGAGP